MQLLGGVLYHSLILINQKQLFPDGHELGQEQPRYAFFIFFINVMILLFNLTRISRNVSDKVLILVSHVSTFRPNLILSLKDGNYTAKKNVNENPCLIGITYTNNLLDAN